MQDWSELWEKILAQVQPYSTQIMLRQQCQLVHFTGQEARIGTRSQNLFKMAKDRLPNIEAAFAQLYQQPIRVTLEVLVRSESAPSIPATSAPATSAPATPPSPPLYPPIAPATPPQVKEESRPPNSFGAADVPAVQSSSPAKGGESGVPVRAPEPPPASAMSASSFAASDFAEPAATWTAEDEVTRAAKSLAQMFNGQIVRWDEGAEGEAAGSAPEDLLRAGQPVLEALDSDPDGDVPF
jgi:DNA polymerase-3 subunit gamma/tau